MNTEIITIGDEILIGQITDTNSAWIAQQLNPAGIRVNRILSVGDTRQEIKTAVTEALADNDFVILTGGLGPTKDDITKQTLAEIFDCRLCRHEPTYEFIRHLTQSRGLDFNELNQSQAFLPEKCEVLPNPNGTAPGMWFEKDGKVLVSLPGVPFEMKAILTDHILPRLGGHFHPKKVIHKTWLTFGLPESMLAQTIRPWEEQLPENLHLAYLPNPNGIRLRLSAYDTEEEVMQVIENQFLKLQELIPEAMVGEEPTSIPQSVAQLLEERKETLAVAESCTGGSVSCAFTATAGASEYFLGSVTAYSNDVKIDLLEVKAEDIEQHGAVSQSVAEQMAEGVRKLIGSDYALATTGIAGPTGGSDEKPVGTVWMAVATPEGTFSMKRNFGEQREQTIQRATAYVINMLRLHLRKLQQEENTTDTGSCGCH